MQVIRNVCGLFGMGWTLAYISYRLVSRAIDWRFLVKRLDKEREAIQLLAQVVEESFAQVGPVERVTTMVYNGRGYGRGESTEERLTLYWDAPLTVTVWTTDGPILGMGVEFRGKVLCVRQLQGVAGVVLPKQLKHWPRVFVEACVDFAELAGMREVRVYKAEQSLFYHFPTLEVSEGTTMSEVLKAHQSRMRHRYEGTARRLGFTKKRKWYSWKVED